MVVVVVVVCVCVCVVVVLQAEERCREGLGARAPKTLYKAAIAAAIAITNHITPHHHSSAART